MKFINKSNTIKIIMIFTIVLFGNTFALIHVAAKNTEIETISSQNKDSKSPDDWTFLVYLDGDNDLEEDAIDDFLEMSSVGSNDNIHIVVQFDRISGYDSRYDDWTGTKRYNITSGMTPTSANAFEDLGEINMGLATSLSNFIDWGTTYFPSDNYALILWNHGNGWKKDEEKQEPLFKGVCYDYSDSDYLDNIELKNALTTTGEYLELIAFDACLMGMIEIDYQIKDLAQVRVASEEGIPLNGFPYDTILSHLQGDPTMSNDELGDIMVNDYMNSYGYNGYQCLSAVDLMQEDTLAAVLDTLSLELIAQIGTYFSDIKNSREATESTSLVDDYIDLYDFAYEIYNRISDTEIQNKALDVMNSISLMNISEAHGIYHPDFHGTTIYFPEIPVLYDSNYETDLDFTFNKHWDEFLHYYYDNFVDDNYEENDDHTSAYNLSSYENTWLSSIDGPGIQADDDWYEIYADPGELFLEVELIFSDSEGDIDLALFDSDGTTSLAYSTSTSDDEYISYAVPSAGTYYLLVYYDDAWNEYDLWWDDTIPPPDDNYEENNDYTSAYDLSSYENTWLSSIDGPGIQADDDWYEIYADPGELFLEVELIFSDSEGDIDLALFDSDGTTSLAYSTSTSDDEYISYAVPSAGTYYLLVYYDDAWNEYDLWWDDIFTDDNYEENDNYTLAYDLSSYEDTWLSSIDGTGFQADDDWYEIYVNPGELFLQVILTFSDSEGDINIELYASDGITALTGNYSITDYENINYFVPSSGTYYLRIFGANAGNEYDLRWDDLIPPDDNYEENDDYISAYNLSAYENEWLNTIDGYGVQLDEDWYEINVDSGREHLIVWVIFNHADGDIDIELYASDGTTFITDSSSTTDNESINYTVPINGTYYLCIRGVDLGNPYNLWWDDLSSTDDNYEENNDYISAYNLSTYKNEWLNTINGTGVQLDEDWYEILIAPGYERLIVDLVFAHIADNLELKIYNSSGILVTGSTSTTDNEYINYLLPSSGTYYIRVYGNDIGNEYDLRWNSILPDDNYEENDDYNTTYDLSGQKNIWLSTVNGFGLQYDEDWYEITIAPSYLQLIVDLTFTHAIDNLDLGIYSSTGTLITGSISLTDNEYINYILPSSGTYYIRVYGNGIGNEYNLRWNSIIPDDNYEENDEYTLAYNLSTYENTLLNTIDGYGVQLDDDWYEIYIDPGYENLTIALTFIHSEGNIDINLYVSDGISVIAIGNSTTDNELLNLLVNSGAVYYIEIYGDNNGNSYNLIWSCLENIPPGDEPEVPEDHEQPGIPGYDLFFLLGAILVISILIIRKQIKRRPRIIENY